MTDSIIAFNQHPRCYAADDGAADSNGHWGIKNAASRAGHRSSTLTLPALLISRLTLVASGFLTLGKRHGALFVANGQVTLSRSYPHRTIRIPHFKLRPGP